MAWPFSEIMFKYTASGRKVQNKYDVQWIIWEPLEGSGYIPKVAFEFVIFRTAFRLPYVCLKEPQCPNYKLKPSL